MGTYGDIVCFMGPEVGLVFRNQKNWAYIGPAMKNTAARRRLK